MRSEAREQHEGVPGSKNACANTSARCGSLLSLCLYRKSVVSTALPSEDTCHGLTMPDAAEASGSQPGPSRKRKAATQNPRGSSAEGDGPSSKKPRKEVVKKKRKSQIHHLSKDAIPEDLGGFKVSFFVLPDTNIFDGTSYSEHSSSILGSPGGFRTLIVSLPFPIPSSRPISLLDSRLLHPYMLFVKAHQLLSESL